MSRGRASRHPGPAIRALALLAALAGGAGSEGAATSFRLPAISAKPGDSATVDLEVSSGAAFQGFSASIAYDPSALSIASVTIRGTISEAVKADFFQANVFRDEGELVIGVLVDALPPFDGQQIPGIGFPLAVARISLRVIPSTDAKAAALRFVDGLGDPPVANVLAIDNQAVHPDDLVDGRIEIARPARFLRGDANSDDGVDVSDPIFILGSIFLRPDPPRCADASDANDDERIDVADAVFLLRFCFLGGGPPPAPYPVPGPDPFDRAAVPLGCEQSQY